MRDFIVMAIILGSIPVCFARPYIGVMMWYWVTYFNPHRFTWSYAHSFPVALCVAIPTLIGMLFARKSFRSLLTIESILLVCLWGWFTIAFVHAQDVPLFSGNMADAHYEMSHISKILLMTIVMIIVIRTREQFRNVVLVTALSLGVLALKSSIFGVRTEGESRVFGPPDSFLQENNAYALALDMCLPLLFFLIRSEPRKWLRVLMRILFGAAVLSILLTYSRGGLVGLGVVLSVLVLRSRHKVFASLSIAVTLIATLSLAPPAWMERMGNFASGNLDSSANMRFTSWTVAWRLSHDYPMGGSFHSVPNVDVYKRYQPRPLPNDASSSGPHSIYFQLLADQGFVGVALFLLLIASCFWTLYRTRRRAQKFPSSRWIVDYTLMLELAILAFMTSGAFLGVVYLDIIYQMVGLTVILKTLGRAEYYLASLPAEAEETSQPRQLPEEVTAPA